MNGDFKIILNMNDDMFKIFEKSFKKEMYEIIEKNGNVIFLKRSKNDLTDKQKKIIISMAKKQAQITKGILFVDVTSEVKYLISIPEENMKTDGKFRWMMRQTFLKAIIEKDKSRK